MADIYRGHYAWPDSYTGARASPEVWASSEEEALPKAIKAFEGLIKRHAVDFTLYLFFPLGKSIEFDPARVSVTFSGTGLFDVGPIEIKPMPMPDMSIFYFYNTIFNLTDD